MTKSLSPVSILIFCIALSWIWNSILDTPLGYHVNISYSIFWKAEFVIQYLSLISSIDVSISLSATTILSFSRIWKLSVISDSFHFFPSSDDIFQSHFWHLSSVYSYRTIHSSKLPYCSSISGLCILKLILYTDLRFIVPRYRVMSSLLSFIHYVFSLCLLILTCGSSPLILSIDWFFFLLSMGHAF